MEDLEILSDSILVTSIQNHDHHSIYKVKNDALFIKQHHISKSSTRYSVEYLGYKILNFKTDTIILKSDYRAESNLPQGPGDSLVFVSLDKLKQPVNNFRYIKLSFNSSFGSVADISVDSTGKVSYLTFPEIKDENGKILALTIGYLSDNEYANFKNVLSKSLIMNLPELRGCDMDDGEKDFEVSIGNKIFITKGCVLHYPQGLLFKYLYGLDKNEGVKNKHTGK